MALNPISFTEKVVSSFLRYQLTAYRFADSRLHAQMRELLSLEKTRATPLLKGPYVSVSRGFRAGATLAELAAEGVVHPALAGLAPFPSVWAHQEAAIRAIRSGRTTVVSTGTGSGKTEAFLYPIISRCLELRDAGAAPGIVAVLVYPMNALAEDQLGRLRDLLSGTGVPFGMYVGKTPERAADVSGVRLPKGSSREEYRRRLAKLRDEKRNEAVHPPEERCSREEMRAAGRAPRILLTNVKQLELLLTRQKDVELFAGSRLEILVVDEAHTFSGANGAETACLLRRLRTFCGTGERETVCVATSATLADRGASDDPARTFASRFFGVPEESVTTVTEEYEEPPFEAERLVPATIPDPARALPAILAALEGADGAAIARAIGGGLELAGGSWREALGESLARNELLFQLSEQLRRPALLSAVAEKVAEACDRPVAEEEVLAWLALGAAARRDGRPFVRPVVHDFVRGIDGAVVSFPEGTMPRLWLSAREEAAAEGGQELVRLPVLTCTTCGQHYFSHSVADLDANGAVPGGGEAAEQGTFWGTLSAEAGGRRLLLTDRVISVDEEENGDEGPDLPKVFFCRHCGTLASAEGGACPACGRPGAPVPLFLVRQKEEAPGHLSRCVSCGAAGRRRGGGYREPARSVRAVTVSDVHVLAQDMVRQLSPRRLLVFADSRQDAAFQAGWMRDHSRRFRLRALMWEELQRGTKTVIDLTAALDRLMEADDELSQALLPEVWAETRKDAGFEHRERRKFFLRVQVLREVTTGLKQRIGLEPWGRLRVDYDGLSAATPGLAALAASHGLDAEALAEGIGGLLDRTRRRMILLDKDKRIFSRFWRDGDPDVLRGFVPAFQGVPTGLKLRREAGDDKNRVSAWVNDQRNTAVLQVVRRWGVPKEHAAPVVEELWKLLAERTKLLSPAVLTGSRGNALPGASGTFQVDADRLLLNPSRGLWRCSECRRAQVRRSPGDVCPSWHCHGTLAREDEPADDYDLSLLDGGVPMLRPREHSAQVPASERERLERLFKDETTEAVNTLVATPTLEMGVDIGALDAILLRNVPPSPANYWQRAGRAGRRERMAVALTYAGARGHDRSAFAEPLRLLAGSVTPPQFNLRNELMVARHVHAAALTRLHSLAREGGAAGEALAATLELAFPAEVRSWLFDAEGRVRREPFDLSGFRGEVAARADDLAGYVSSVFRGRWPEADAAVVAEERVARLVGEMPDRLEDVLKTLRKRLDWALAMMARLDRERAERGVLERDEESIHDRCKALVRKLKGESRRARGGTEGYDDANTFGVLAAEGFLPGYGLETGSIQGIPVFPRGGAGMEDFSLPRPPAVALREYVPGNLIYANGNRFVARLFHFEAEERPAYFLVDAEREAVEEVSAPGAAPAGGAVAPVAAVTAPLRAAAVTDVELVHTSQITDEEDFRFQLAVSIFALERDEHGGGRAFCWGPREVQHRRAARLRLVNVGVKNLVTKKDEFGFPVCTVCGQSRSPFASREELQEFREKHQQRCRQPVEPTGFYADLVADVLRLPAGASRREAFSVLEALRAAAAQTLEMELEDLQVVVVGRRGEETVDGLLYDPMPGGSGLLDQLLERFPEVVAKAVSIARDCPAGCGGSCPDCLQVYRNAAYHGHLDRALVVEKLTEWGEALTLSHEIPPKQPAARPSGERAPSNAAEDTLRELLHRAGFPEAQWQKRIDLGRPLGGTVPDAFYSLDDEDEPGLCIYVDGLSASLHGDPERRRMDRVLREELQARGYVVIEIPASDLADREAVARAFSRIARKLVGSERAQSLRTDTSWFESGGEPAAVGPVVVPFRRVEAAVSEQFRTCVPLVELAAAAGGWGEAGPAGDDEWVEPTTTRKLRKGMFVAQVKGSSMEPLVADGCWCLFASPVEGSRTGRTLLVQLRDPGDPEDGGRLTLKRFESREVAGKDSPEPGAERSGRVVLRPRNESVDAMGRRQFSPLEVEDDFEGSVRVIAELLEVLPSGA